MSALPAEQQEIAAQAFHYLVTPSGSKIAHSAADLADYLDLPEAQVGPVMEGLAGIGRTRPPTGAAPVEEGAVVRYEIFHDVLAAAILDWRSRFVQAHQLAAERAENERRFAAERRRVFRLRAVLVGVSVLLLAVVGLAVVTFQQSNAIGGTTRIDVA